MSILFCLCSHSAINLQGDDAETETGMEENNIDNVVHFKRPSIKVDWELYGEYLEASDMTETEAREFIENLWSIVVSFVRSRFWAAPHPTNLWRSD